MKRRELVLAAVAAGFGAGVNAQGSFPPAGMTIKYVVPFPPGGLTAVSYTHLRAHETVLDLVCRLLLEKKKKKSILKRT